MEIINLHASQLISECELIKITIGEYSGNWALETATLVTRGGEICLEDEAIKIHGDYYHEDEFDQYDIVYDHYNQEYDFDGNCLYGYVDSNDSKGDFSRDADWVEYEDTYYMTEAIASDYGIYHCSDCNITYSEHGGCDCDEDDDLSYCFDYHSNYREDFSNDSIYKIGFEVEKEDEAVRNDELAYDLFSETGWAKELDGSLGCDGFELVSPVFPLEVTTTIYEQPLITESVYRVESYLNAEYTKKCGGHINISRQGANSQELLESIGGYLPLFYSLYQNRVRNTYSPAKSLRLYTSEREKYCSFHCKSNGVIEVRIFPAVKNITNLLWRAELLRLILANPTHSYKTALAQIANPKNGLHQHLLKIFDKQQLFNKVKLFVKYAAEFEQVQFTPKLVNHNLGKIYKVA